MNYETANGTTTEIDKALSKLESLLELLDNEMVTTDSVGVENLVSKVSDLIDKLNTSNTAIKNCARGMGDIDQTVKGG